MRSRRRWRGRVRPRTSKPRSVRARRRPLRQRRRARVRGRVGRAELTDEVRRCAVSVIKPRAAPDPPPAATELKRPVERVGGRARLGDDTVLIARGDEDDVAGPPPHAVAALHPRAAGQQPVDAEPATVRRLDAAVGAVRRSRALTDPRARAPARGRGEHPRTIKAARGGPPICSSASSARNWFRAHLPRHRRRGQDRLRRVVVVFAGGTTPLRRPRRRLRLSRPARRPRPRRRRLLHRHARPARPGSGRRPRGNKTKPRSRGGFVFHRRRERQRATRAWLQDETSPQVTKRLAARSRPEQGRLGPRWPSERRA